jgi:2-polyprenyl-3-methyl-5-hydroxy-6-metoxy-1,4-benzoquinol methylase
MGRSEKFKDYKIPQSHFDDVKKIEETYWWHVGRLYWAKQFIIRWMEDNAFTEPIHYADLGCGTGGFGIAIQNQFAIDDTTLIDKDLSALKTWNSSDNILPLTKNLEADFSLYQKPNLISCMDVIEHIHNDDLFLQRIYSVLDNEGILILSTAAHPFLYSKWDEKLGHYRRYTKSGLVKKLAAAGFQVKRVSYGWSFLFPLVPYRWLFSKRQEALHYPKVPNWLNQTLIQLSKWESRLSSWLSLPFGTSIFIMASKESK